MPTTYGTKTRKKDIRKRSPNLDMDRLADLVREKREDGKYLSHQEIADRMGCSRVAVTTAIQRLPEWVIKDRDVEDYKRDRADIFAHAQQLILRYITADKLRGASLQQLGTLFGIFYDKERLERGQATSHIAEISINKIDSETLKFINKAIEARTRAMLDKTHLSNKMAEPVSDPGDSGVSVVGNTKEIEG